jgi:hypothetical protein
MEYTFYDIVVNRHTEQSLEIISHHPEINTRVNIVQPAFRVAAMISTICRTRRQAIKVVNKTKFNALGVTTAINITRIVREVANASS